jgi:XTP/dITP diphosphohydrolase
VAALIYACGPVLVATAAPLAGEPGVSSARYAGGHGDDRANLDLVLRRLDERGLREPEAYFECAVCIALPGAPGEVVVEASGRVHGRIVHEPRGENGFGYDPIFFHPESGCTTAEMAPETKNALSHRAAALRSLAGTLAADPDLRARIEE